MNNRTLKLSLQSDISDDFCNLLKEYEVGYKPEPVSRKINSDRMCYGLPGDFDAKEIIIAIIQSKPIWTTIGTAIAAFSFRHSKKSIIIEKDGFKFKATGMSQDELARSLEGATKLLITTSSPKD